MSNRHRGAGLVASFHSAMFAESNVVSLVNGRLIGIIVIWQQGLLKLALRFKGTLEKRDKIRSETLTSDIKYKKHATKKHATKAVTCKVNNTIVVYYVV